MIWIRALWGCLLQLLLELRSSPIPFTFRQRRVAGLWWKWITDRRARERLARIGWDLLPIISGGSESPIGYVRIRVVNPRAVNFGPDGFEAVGGTYSPGSAKGPFLWHSLGNEAGSDQSKSYWNDLAGVSTYAANTLSIPNGGKSQGGADDWTDGTPFIRFKWITGLTAELLFHVVDANNYVYAGCDATHIFVGSLIAGVNTVTTNNVIAALTNNNLYWLQLIANGTGYTAAIYNDTGPGKIGTQIGTAVGTISNAAVQTGSIGLAAGGAAMLCGGAFPYVCFVSAPAPDGWWPVITAGEPAFSASKTTPQAGTYSALIQVRGSAAGSGAWQKAAPFMLAGSNTLTAQAKASAGTANVSAGGQVTGNAAAAFGQLSATGAMTASPAILLNYSGAIGKAYFDTVAIAIDPTIAVITEDLPHPHQATWTISSFQPGSPSTNGVGSWKVPLFPPGSEEYAEAKAIYDRLDYYLRVEAYLGLSAKSIPLTFMKFAGVITAIERGRGGSNYISGASDLQLAALSPTFPGELLPNVLTSAALKGYMGLIEAGAMDAFSPYTAANYLSSQLPATTIGTWSAATQDGMPTVSCATGTGAALISQAGGAAQDAWHTVYVEATGTLIASNDATNAGKIGVGMSGQPTDCNTSIVGYVTAKKNATTGRWDLDARIEVYANGAVFSGPFTASNVLASVDEPTGTLGSIPITIGLLMSLAGTAGFITQATLIVNGQVAVSQAATGLDPANLFNWPFLFSGTPTTGSATAYLTNLIQLTRYTADQHPNDAAFIPGTVTVTSNGAQISNQAGPNLLDMLMQMATREGFYLRYTPKPYVAGVRTLGTIDFSADPGADLTGRCMFSEVVGNLDGLQFLPNADPAAASTTATAAPAPGSGGLAYVRNIAAMFKFGPLQDQVLGATAYGFPALRRIGLQSLANKALTGLSGSKKASFLRDSNADVWRELDRVQVDDPEVGANKQSMRILQYSFTEGSDRQPVILDQFSSQQQQVLGKRQQQGLFAIASQFTHR